MKQFIVIITAILFLGCNENDDSIGPLIPLSANAINGKWELERRFVSSGGPGAWLDVTENGSVYSFLSNGKFSFQNNASLEQNREGTFRLEEDSLILIFELDGEAQEFTYFVEISKQRMILSPTAPFICIEGCSEQFKRVD